MRREGVGVEAEIGRIAIPKGKIGFFYVGHEPYWEQFPTLQGQLAGYAEQLKDKLRAQGEWEIIDGGLVDTAARAFAVGRFFRAQDLDLLFCFTATYAPAATVLPVVQQAGVGIVLLGLQPSPKLDCVTATTYAQLCHDNITSLPEISCVLQRAGIVPLGILVGMLQGDARVDRELKEWGKVATVLRSVRKARIGLLGHVYEGMLDMHSDPTMFHAAFGMHIEMLEMCDLKALTDEVTTAEIIAKEELIRRVFTFAEAGADPLAGPVEPQALAWSARLACALEKLVSRSGLTGLAYYYRGREQNQYEQLAAGLIVGSSILTGRGVPIAGEADLKTCVAMLIMDRLGIGGSFAELHPVDFEDNIVLVGHDGPAHIRISDDKPILRNLSLYHGKRGSGLSVEFKIKTGLVTLLGLTQTAAGKFKFVAASGESLRGEIPATGNTNTRVRFGLPVSKFIEDWVLAGPTHHFALGVGNALPVLKKVAKALGVEITIIG